MGPGHLEVQSPNTDASRLAGVAIGNTGILVLDSSLQVLATNSVAEQIVARADALTLSGRELRAIRARDHERLRAACHDATVEAGAVWHGIVLPRRSGQRDYLLSIARASLGGIRGGALHVSIVDPESCFCMPVDQLQTYFALTPAQCALTRLIANGYRLEAAAAQLGIKISTARSHLTAIFRKTGTDRVAALVHVLALLWSSSQLQLAVTRSLDILDSN